MEVVSNLTVTALCALLSTPAIAHHTSIVLSLPPPFHATMSDVGYLEYGEESDGDDLFGSDNEDVPAAFRDTRAPIVPSDAARSGSSKQKQPEPTPPNYAPISRTDKGETEQRVTPDQRLVQLRRQRATLSPPPEFGVPSLKTLCAQSECLCGANTGDETDFTQRSASMPRGSMISVVSSTASWTSFCATALASSWLKSRPTLL